VVLIPTLPLELIYCLTFPSPSEITTFLDEVLISNPPELPVKLPIITLYDPVVTFWPALLPKLILYSPELVNAFAKAPIAMFCPPPMFSIDKD